MNSDKLREGLDFLKEWKATPSERLREALALLEKAHNALDALEGQVQDLKDDAPGPWKAGILKALDEMPTDQIGPYLEGAKELAGMEHGYTSPEWESVSMLADAITQPVDTYR